MKLSRLNTKQPPAKAGGFELRAESPDTHRLNDAFELTCSTPPLLPYTRKWYADGAPQAGEGLG